MVDETSASFFEGGNVLLAIAPARLSTWQQRQEVQGILRKANGETSESNRIRLPPPKTGAGSAYERDLLATEFSSAQRSKSFSPNPMASGFRASDRMRVPENQYFRSTRVLSSNASGGPQHDFAQTRPSVVPLSDSASRNTTLTRGGPSSRVWDGLYKSMGLNPAFIRKRVAAEAQDEMPPEAKDGASEEKRAEQEEETSAQGGGEGAQEGASVQEGLDNLRDDGYVQVLQNGRMRTLPLQSRGSPGAISSGASPGRSRPPSVLDYHHARAKTAGPGRRSAEDPTELQERASHPKGNKGRDTPAISFGARAEELVETLIGRPAMRGGGGDWTTEASKLGSQVDLDAAGVTVEEADRFVSLLHATKPPPARPYYEQDQARAALLYQLAANRRAPDAPGGSWEDPSGRVPPSRAIPERAADRHARVPRVSRAQRQLLCYLRFNMHTACRASTSKALLDLFEQQDPSNTRSVSVRKFFRVLEYATGVEVTVERERLLLEAFRDAVDDDAVDYFSFVTALMRETHDLRLPDGADAPRGSRVKMTQSCVFDDLQLLRPRSPHSGRELSIEELRAAEERPMVRAPGHGRQGPAQEQFMTDHQRALRAIPARRSPAAVRSRPGADPATSASSRSLAKWLDGSSSAVADPAGTEEETKKNKQGDNFGSDDRDTTNRSSMALQDTVDARAVADLTGAVKLQPAAVAPRRSAMSPPGRQVSRGGRVAFPEYPVIQVAGDEGGIGTDSRPYLLPGSVEEDYLRVESPPESTIGANSPISAMAQSSQRDRLTAQPLQKNFSANDAKLLPTGRNHSLSADAGRYTSSGNFTALRAQQTTEGVGVGLAGRQGASHDGDDSLVVRIAQALRAASPDRGAARSEASLAETRADETDVMSTARRIAAALQSAKVSDQGSGGPLREATWSVEYRNKVHPAVMADKLRHGSEACEPGDWAPSNVVNRGIGARQRAEAFARSKEKLLENSRAKGANWSMEHPGGATQPAQWASTMRDAQERRVRAETPTLRERLSSKQRGGAHLRAVPWSVAERHLVHLQRYDHKVVGLPRPEPLCRF